MTPKAVSESKASRDNTPSAKAAIILAAGEGKRMRSSLPKVLHPVGGVPMIAHVVQAAIDHGCEKLSVVVGKEHRRLKEVLTARFPDAPLQFAVQEEQLGTADAASVGLKKLKGFNGRVVILCGDVPLISKDTLDNLDDRAGRYSVGVLSAMVDDATGYGRMVHERTKRGRRLVKIVEHRDADEREIRINEINAGIYNCDAEFLAQSLKKIGKDNDQGEFYLTDVVSLAKDERGAVAVRVDDVTEVQGVNDRMQLAEVEVGFRHRKILNLMADGVTFLDPNTVIIGAEVRVAADAIIGPSVQLIGKTRIAAGAIVDGPTVVKDSFVGAGAHIKAFSHLESAQVAKEAVVGPYARLRPDAVIGEGAKIGNFVEVKNAFFDRGAKANHLAYIGDADIGAQSNVGAGTITCNYDGAQKHRTKLGEGVFVGSNATLVAPVALGDGVYVAAGSTITKDVEADALAFGRARQESRAGYAKTLRKKMGVGTKAKMAKEPAPKDDASKKAASKKAPAKKATSKTAASKKTATSKKTAAKKAATKKPATKKAASKKTATKKAVSKKAPAKKAPTKKAASKKKAAKKK